MGKRAETPTPVKKPDVEVRSETKPSETEASAPAAQAEQTDAVENEEEVVEEAEEKPASEAERSAPTPSTPAETKPTDEEIRGQELERSTTIRSAVRLAGLGEDVADELANNPKMSADLARAEIFKRLEAKAPETTNQRFEVKDMDAKQTRKEQATRAILHRFDSSKYEMKQGDTEIGRGSLVDIARNYLHAEGAKDAYQLSRSEVAKRALHHSSDFPEVLANVANKTLRDGYDGVAATYKPFVGTPKNVSDFKEISSVVLGNGGKLEEVMEDGEYKRTTLEESAEKYRVKKFGTIVGKTWELLMNDDLDAFTDISRKLGVRAREKENEIFWNMIIANPLMAETGLALFHATHGNVTTPQSAISIATLGVAREKMRLMKDLEGELAGVSPSYLVVPAALETLAEQFLTQTNPDQAGNVNPFANKLKLIVEGRLDASSQTAWYVMSDAQKIAMAQMALLDGKGPEMFVREGFDVDGMELKIRYCFGMKVLDYRGFFRNKTV